MKSKKIIQNKIPKIMRNPTIKTNKNKNKPTATNYLEVKYELTYLKA